MRLLVPPPLSFHPIWSWEMWHDDPLFMTRGAPSLLAAATCDHISRVKELVSLIQAVVIKLFLRIKLVKTSWYPLENERKDPDGIFKPKLEKMIRSQSPLIFTDVFFCLPIFAAICCAPVLMHMKCSEWLMVWYAFCCWEHFIMPQAMTHIQVALPWEQSYNIWKASISTNRDANVTRFHINTLIVNNWLIINNYCIFQTISRSIVQVVSVTKCVIKRKKHI